jgi:hypothetical protein
MQLPERPTADWIDSLTDRDLLLAESRLHATFFALEREQKALLGAKYDLMRGPAELMAAWDHWTRVNTATRSRGLNPSRKHARSGQE